MGNSIKVSVLVTFYNQKEYVERALKSVINQKTNFSYEIFIGDDGSTDGTIEEITRLMKLYPQDLSNLYVMERDSGRKYIGGFRASRNRLNLLNHVSGEYFIFLDGDDFFTDVYKLQKQVDVLDMPENKNCVACGHHVEMLFPDGRRRLITSTKIQEGKYTAEKYWGEGIYFHPDSMLIRSFVIKTIPLDLVENNFNDNVITFLVLKHGGLYFINQVMATYSITGMGIWTGGNQIMNMVRSVMSYDICNKINPDLIKENERRNRPIWRELIGIRDKLDRRQLYEIECEAIAKGLNNTLDWVTYNDKDFSDRMKILFVAFRRADRGLCTRIRYLLKPFYRRIKKFVCFRNQT